MATTSIPAKKPAPPPPDNGTGRINEIAGNVREQVARSGNAGKIGEGGFHAPDETQSIDQMDKAIQKNLSDRISGKNPRFSDEIMRMQKEKLFRETQGQTRRGRMALMADAARRGVFRSEATGSLIRDVEMEGIRSYSSGVKDLMIKKAEMDHEDMIQAINQGQQFVAATRQYQLGLEQNAIAREQIKATLAAAAMQAAASRYAADQGLKGARAAAGASRYAANLALQSSSSLTYNNDTGAYEQTTYIGSDGGTYPMTTQQMQGAGF